MDTKYELIFCVVNAGFSDTAMTAARRAGATGGTILKGRGIVSKDAEEQYKITIQPEKEVLMLLIPKTIKDDVLRALYDFVGLGTDGQGIAFSMPVEKAVGLKDSGNPESEERTKE